MEQQPNTAARKRGRTIRRTYDFAALPDDALLRIDAVAMLVGYAEGTIRNMLTKKKFPEPTHISRNSIRWRYGVIKDYLRARGGEHELADAISKAHDQQKDT